MKDGGGAAAWRGCTRNSVLYINGTYRLNVLAQVYEMYLCV